MRSGNRKTISTLFCWVQSCAQSSRYIIISINNAFSTSFLGWVALYIAAFSYLPTVSYLFVTLFHQRVWLKFTQLQRSICCCNSFFLSKFFLMRDGEDLFQIHSQCCQFFIIKFSYSLLSSSTTACSLLLSVDSTLLFLDVIWGLLFLYINVHHQ